MPTKKSTAKKSTAKKSTAKKSTAKKSTAKKSTAKKTEKPTETSALLNVSDEAIALSAYLKAEADGFSSDPTTYWLQAEAELKESA